MRTTVTETYEVELLLVGATDTDSMLAETLFTDMEDDLTDYAVGFYKFCETILQGDDLTVIIELRQDNNANYWAIEEVQYVSDASRIKSLIDPYDKINPANTDDGELYDAANLVGSVRCVVRRMTMRF